MVLLIVSSQILVWGAVAVAQNLGVSDLVIGLTIIALGTSLPELAASVIAARKGEHGIALGNIIGSNMFNLLVVVGIAGMIAPTSVPPEVLSRDFPIMFALILGLFVMAYGFRGPGRINRVEGLFLVAIYLARRGTADRERDRPGSGDFSPHADRRCEADHGVAASAALAGRARQVPVQGPGRSSQPVRGSRG